MITSLQKVQTIMQVLIQPCNENQELNYMETFKGTPEGIIRHSLEIIKGLQTTLTQGSFTVKIESPNLDDCIYVDEQNIYDENFEVISSIRDGEKIFLRNY